MSESQEVSEGLYNEACRVVGQCCLALAMEQLATNGDRKNHTFENSISRLTKLPHRLTVLNIQCFRVRFNYGILDTRKDHAKQILTMKRLCRVDADCRVLETSSGYAVIDVSRRPKQGDHVLVSFCGIIQLGIVRGRALITSDGEAIEGDALDDVEVKGVLTFLINRATYVDEDPNPVI